MLQRIAQLLLVFMFLWLPLQGQAMVASHHGSAEQSQQALTTTGAAADDHHACHQADASDMDTLPNAAGDCQDGNCCYLCHAALTGLDSSSHPLLAGTTRPLPDLRSPSIFFEQPQRPPLA